MRLVTLFFGLLYLPYMVHADMSPNPLPYYVTDDDGVSQGPIFLKGSAKYAWEEDEDGFTVMSDGKRRYYYAHLNESSGDLVATRLPIRTKLNGTLVGLSPLDHGLERHERPHLDVRMHKCGDFCKEKMGHGRELRKLVPTTGTLKNLIVLFRFSDHTSRVLPTAANITKLMNHAGNGVGIPFDPVAPTGSVR
jgi:hypothetical protein